MRVGSAARIAGAIWTLYGRAPVLVFTRFFRDHDRRLTAVSEGRAEQEVVPDIGELIDGPMFAAEIRKKRVAHMRGFIQWRWHLDEAFVKINGKLCYLWRAVDHEGEVLEAVVTAKRDKSAALKFLKRIMIRYGRPRKIITDA